MVAFLESFSKFTVFIFFTIIFWLTFPPTYVLVTPLYLYRLIVKWVARRRHPEWVGMMNVRDVFVSEDMRNPKGLTSTVSLILVLKGVPNYTELRKSFTEKVLLQPDKLGELAYEKFHYYSEDWMGFPFWKHEENFSLEQHIRPCEETLGRKETTERDLMEIMGPLTTKLFMPKTSPWEMIIVENYKPATLPCKDKGKIPIYCFSNNNNNNNNNDNPDDNKNARPQVSEEDRFAVIFRFHHTLCDGFSVAKLIVENFSGQPKQNTPRAPREKIPFWKSVLLFMDCFIQVGIAHFKLLILDYDFNRWHVPLGKLTGKWNTFMTDPIPFELAREASRRSGVATTSVLFGAIAGGIRRFWKLNDKSGSDMPKLMRGLFALPMRGHPLDGLVNHWTFANVPLPLKYPDVQKRLEKINRNFEQLKKSAVPGMVWAFTPLYMAVPRWLINLWGANRMTTVTLSNFPGPRKACLLFERWPVEDTWYWLPRLRGNASMHMAILTYNGSIRITVAADKYVLESKQAQKLAQCIQEEMYSFQDLPTRKELEIEIE
ncbi:unnamed protein product [Allacma fusca]|uniref:O-acyltransferase WSD1 C-terminal domain-containing protein n=1 Tax=Allacma fusca TaxID=39272 RepID=A0A8J2K4G8_9HEXA|nr:unnamed protein product [Allacma fusca]